MHSELPYMGEIGGQRMPHCTCAFSSSPGLLNHIRKAPTKTQFSLPEIKLPPLVKAEQIDSNLIDDITGYFKSGSSKKDTTSTKEQKEEILPWAAFLESDSSGGVAALMAQYAELFISESSDFVNEAPKTTRASHGPSESPKYDFFENFSSITGHMNEKLKNIASHILPEQENPESQSKSGTSFTMNLSDDKNTLGYGNHSHHTGEVTSLSWPNIHLPTISEAEEMASPIVDGINSYFRSGISEKDKNEEDKTLPWASFLENNSSGGVANLMSYYADLFLSPDQFMQHEFDSTSYSPHSNFSEGA